MTRGMKGCYIYCTWIKDYRNILKQGVILSVTRIDFKEMYFYGKSYNKEAVA
jgi:hypothetical protein